MPSSSRSLLVGAAALCAVAPVAQAVDLSVSPGKVELAGEDSVTVSVPNTNTEPLNYSTSVLDFRIGLDGQIQIADPKGKRPLRSARRWLRVVPEEFTVPPGESADLTIRSAPGRTARPGDSHAVVVLSHADAGAVASSIGVTATLRVPGRLKRNLRVGKLKLLKSGKKRAFRFSISNRGNLIERFTRGQLRVALYRGKKRVAVLRTRSRTVLPGTSAVITMPYRGKGRGRLRAVARIRMTPPPRSGPGAAGVKPKRALITRRRAVRL